MKKYKTIRAGEVQPGDILKCSVYTWDESIKARKHWDPIRSSKHRQLHSA